MIRVDVLKVEDGEVTIRITPETEVRPILGFYHVQSKFCDTYIFRESISEPIELRYEVSVDGDYVVFVGILEEDTIYVTDVESFTVKAPVKPAAPRALEALSVVVPVVMAGVCFVARYLIK